MLTSTVMAKATTTWCGEIKVYFFIHWMHLDSLPENVMGNRTFSWDFLSKIFHPEPGNLSVTTLPESIWPASLYTPPRLLYSSSHHEVNRRGIFHWCRPTNVSSFKHTTHAIGRSENIGPATSAERYSNQSLMPLTIQFCIRARPPDQRGYIEGLQLIHTWDVLVWDFIGHRRIFSGSDLFNIFCQNVPNRKFYLMC